MYGKILIRCDLEVRTGMHIGGSSAFSAIGAVDSPVVRDPYTGYPIVPGSSLKGKLRTLLASSGVTVVNDPAQATATLVVLRESDGRRTVSADRFDVKREYILAYDVSYEVRLVNGKVLVPAESLIANRALLFDENQVLGFEAAQEALANSMAEDLAWQIIRRLQALKS